MHKPAKDKHFIRQPWYEGGDKAMKNFIGENLVYPPDALAGRLEGTVSLRYDIDYQGNVTDAKVISGIGHGCDEEAVRLVKLLKFKVEKPRGLRVLFHKTIQIHFRLSAALPLQNPLPPASMQVTYTVSTTHSTDENPPSGYTYTVQL